MKEPRQVWKRREQSQERRELVILSRRGGKRLSGGGGQAMCREGRRLEASPVPSLAEDGAGGKQLSVDFESLQEVLAILPLAWRWITALSQSSLCHEHSLLPWCLILQGYSPGPSSLPGAQRADSTSARQCQDLPSPHQPPKITFSHSRTSFPPLPCLWLHGPCG